MMTDQRKFPEDLAAMTAWIRANAEPGARILEIGCGDGAFVEELADEFDIIGVDPVATAGERIVAGGFEDLDAAPFDLVFASVALHHLADEDAAVEALRRLTREGSVMLVREFDIDTQDHDPTLRWWYDRYRASGRELADFDEWTSHWRGHMHHHIWTWKKVSSMLARAGFQTVEELVVPYLYRWELEESDRAAEERDAAAGLIRLVGRQWTGRR